jgi:hypothetical protein
MKALVSQFEATVGKWIGFLDAYSLDRLQRRPPDGSWSLGQVYVHMINDTRFFVGQMRAALFSEEHTGDPMTPWAVSMFAAGSFPEGRIQGPATHTPIPQPESIEELRAALDGILRDVHGIDFSGGRGKTGHPGLGYFTASEWLQFAEMHLRHHFRQKERIDAALFQKSF